MCGHLMESGANAIIQSDIIQMKDCMNIKATRINELFTTHPRQRCKRSVGNANDDDDVSEDSYDSDDDASMDSEFSDSDTEPQPRSTTIPHKMPGLRKGFLFSFLRAFLHVFHPFAGMLPLLFFLNAYPSGNYEEFFTISKLLKAAIIRIQLYLPFLRYNDNFNYLVPLNHISPRFNLFLVLGKHPGRMVRRRRLHWR